MTSTQPNPVQTTDAGIPVQSDTYSLTVGAGGPILLQDSYLIEQMANFNRERIKERQPHAKGSGAFGRFEVAPRHQRGHPSQRGLLLGQLTQPRLIGWITARPPVGGTGAGIWRVHKATVTRCLAASNVSRPRRSWPFSRCGCLAVIDGLDGPRTLSQGEQGRHSPR